MHPRGRRFLGALLALLGLLTGVLARVGADTIPSSDRRDVRGQGELAAATPCPLCKPEPTTPIVPLSAADVYAVGRSLAESNEARITHIDSLRRAGCFGDPESGDAQGTAHLLARLTTLNAYAYVANFAIAPTCIFEAEQSALVPAFESFSGPGQYPITRLIRARMGLGRICLRYDLETDLDTTMTLGERTVEVRVGETRIDGQDLRALSMMWPTGLDDIVEVLITDHYTASVTHRESAGPPAPYETFLLHDMDGFWIRKRGTHRPRALVFWVTPRVAETCVLPRVPLIGMRVYVPQLKLRLPLLPDVGFDDLREMDLPQPLLRLEYVRGSSHPAWLQASAKGLDGWQGFGPLPNGVRERFPDQ